MLNSHSAILHQVLFMIRYRYGEELFSLVNFTKIRGIAHAMKSLKELKYLCFIRIDLTEFVNMCIDSTRLVLSLK